MSANNLNDFRPDNVDFDSDDDLPIQDSDSPIPSSGYHEEINTIRIDKLSNKVTIISIIIPCLIGAILIFAYLDMKERVVDADVIKQNQVEKVSQQLEEKVNALDVKIARNRFGFDKKISEYDKKNVAIEGQISKLTSQKADVKSIKTQLSKIEKQITNNTNQDKKTLASIDRIKAQTLASIKDNQLKFNTSAKQIKEDINLFKEEFDARLLELSHYELQIGELRKDLSLLDKKFKNLEQMIITKDVLDEKLLNQKSELSSQMIKLDKSVKTLNQKLTANVSRLEKDIDLLMKTSSEASKKSSSTNSKPEPQINIDSGSIEEESLTQ
jgi:chromosome segregation ATPase